MDLPTSEQAQTIAFQTQRWLDQVLRHSKVSLGDLVVQPWVCADPRQVSVTWQSLSEAADPESMVPALPDLILHALEQARIDGHPLRAVRHLGAGWFEVSLVWRQHERAMPPREPRGLPRTLPAAPSPSRQTA